MKRQTLVYRSSLLIGALLFGYLGVNAVVGGRIRVGKISPTEIQREKRPAEFWIYTGSSLVLSGVAVSALVQSFRGRTESEANEETNA